MKKEYTKPTIEIVEIKTEDMLLTPSSVGKSSNNSFFDFFNEEQ